MKTITRHLLIGLSSLLLLTQLSHAGEKRYFPEFRIEGGGFISSQDLDHNPSTGETYFHTVKEFGIETGLNCRISRYHFVSVWGDVGFGGYSMILLSHVKGGMSFLYGDLTGGFAAGPVVAIGTTGKMLGLQICFRKFYLKGLAAQEEGYHSEFILHSYSVSLGYAFDVWHR